MSAETQWYGDSVRVGGRPVKFLKHFKVEDKGKWSDSNRVEFSHFKRMAERYLYSGPSGVEVRLEYVSNSRKK